MIQVINPVEYQNWNDLLLSLPGYSFFHTAEWAQLLQNTYHYKPSYFVDLENGQLKSVLPVMIVDSFLTGKRGVSLPFSDYCEPLLSDPDRFRAVMDHIINFGSTDGWKYWELRGGKEYLSNEPASESFRGHILDLTCGAERVFRNLRNSTKRNIQKARKEGLTTLIACSQGAINSFYHLNSLTRKKHGLPSQPYLFFRNLYKNIIAPGKGFVSLALYQDKIIAAAVFILFGKKAIYKYGASDEQYSQLRANNLVMWQAIEHCCAIGYETLCLGRTDLDHEGLRQFKNGWNVKEYNIHYYRYSFAEDRFNKANHRAYALGSKYMRRLPAPILNFVGRVTYRHIG
jgi:hypothetical protein